jgi:hypothetical protein
MMKTSMNPRTDRDRKDTPNTTLEALFSKQNPGNETPPVTPPKHCKPDLKIKLPPRFPCTICDRGFEKADAWRYHELNEHWIHTDTFVCMPEGYLTEDGSKCEFCDEPFRAEDLHHKQHNIERCLPDCNEKARRYFSVHAGTFIGHLQKVHGWRKGDSFPLTWLVASPSTYCGFCGREFFTTEQRMVHVQNHFLHGRTMTEWSWNSWRPERSGQAW